MEREDIERRMQEVRKARKDSLEIFRSKGKELRGNFSIRLLRDIGQAKPLLGAFIVVHGFFPGFLDKFSNVRHFLALYHQQIVQQPFQFGPLFFLPLEPYGIMLQVMRMLAVATTTHIGAPRECWIIDMKGSTEDIIKFRLSKSNSVSIFSLCFISGS